MQNSADSFVTQGQLVSLMDQVFEKMKQNNADLLEKVVERLSEPRQEEETESNNSFEDEVTPQSFKKRRSNIADLVEGRHQDRDDGDEEVGSSRKTTNSNRSLAQIHYEQELQRVRKWKDSSVDDFAKQLEDGKRFRAIFEATLPSMSNLTYITNLIHCSSFIVLI